eukprot:c5430_g1_i2.p1 GENE.c5430_g1_i2~~c5430_g1_i2.p1  ORF type:complete len:318 (-),score=89.35 c5430_g1_i2:62-1015(-)
MGYIEHTRMSALLARQLVRIHDAATAFKVMQFNVLADALSGADEHHGGFIHTPFECLDWEYRKSQLLEEVKRFDPDVVCMEEVDHYDDWFQPQLASLGYSSHFLPKAKPPPTDGCALFYKTSTFQPTTATSASVSDPQETIHITYPNASQVALLVPLTHISTNKQIIFSVTHLKATKDESGEVIRVEQATHLLDALHTTHTTTTAATPHILCADLNAQPIASGNIQPRSYQAILENSLQLDSAYRAHTGSEPDYTTWKLRKHEAKMTIDYVFFSKEHFVVTELLSIPTPEEMPTNRLPALEYPSDHFAILAGFAWKE